MTSIQYKNFTKAANLSKQLSRYLLGNWTSEFDSLMNQLCMAIITVNSTRVDTSLAEGLAFWISTTVSHFKEWAGVAGFGLLLGGGILLLLWIMCRLRAQHRRDKVVIAQALAALEAGSSANI